MKILYTAVLSNTDIQLKNIAINKKREKRNKEITFENKI